MKEKPSEISDTKAIVRMPSAAPTMDPAIASRLLWKADPMLLLNVTTAARSKNVPRPSSAPFRPSMTESVQLERVSQRIGVHLCTHPQR